MEWVPAIPPGVTARDDDPRRKMNRVGPAPQTATLPSIPSERHLLLSDDLGEPVPISDLPLLGEEDGHHPLGVHANGDAHATSRVSNNEAAATPAHVGDLVSGSSPPLRPRGMHQPVEPLESLVAPIHSRPENGDHRGGAESESVSREGGEGVFAKAEERSRSESDRAATSGWHEPTEQDDAATRSPQFAWHRDRKLLERRIRTASLAIAVTGIVGAMLACISLELVIFGENPRSISVDLLKLGNSILTFITLILLIFLYYYEILYEKLSSHIREGKRITDVTLSDWLNQSLLALELVVCGIHLPPGFSSEYQALLRGLNETHITRNEVLYVIINSLRVYLIFRPVRDFLLFRLPRRYAVSICTDVTIKSVFAIKMLFQGWWSVVSIMFLWTASIALGGYWYRILEIQACLLGNTEHELCQTEAPNLWTLDGHTYFVKENDLEWSNPVWIMFITSTTVGYGDVIPTTLAGRTICTLVAVGGLVFAALLTAALTNAIVFTPEEHGALLLLQRQAARNALMRRASDFIVEWYRCKRRGVHFSGGSDLLTATRHRFRAARKTATLEVEECSADVTKLDRIGGYLMYISDALSIIKEKEAAALATTEEEHARGNRSIESLTSTRGSLGDQFVHRLAAATKKQEADRELGPEAGGSLMSLSSRRYRSKSSRRRETVATPGIVAGACSAPAGNSTLNAEDGPGPSAGAGGAAAGAEAEAEGGGSLSNGSAKGGGSHGGRSGTTLSRGAGAGTKDWRLSRSGVEQRQVRNIAVLAGCALVGIVSIVVQLELVVHDEDVHSPRVELLKGLNSAVSVALVLLLLQQYYLNDLVGRLDDHIRRNRPLELSSGKWDFLLQARLWVEVVLCGPHLPPTCTFTLQVNSFDNFLLYRAEQLGCVYGMVRVYLLWRLVKYWALADLPSKSAVSLITNVRLGSSFALKRMLNGIASTIFLAGLWILSCGVIAYLYRAAEMTACHFSSTSHEGCDEWDGQWVMSGIEFKKNNDAYVWTPLWVAAMTTTSVGYGEVYPTTHLGRFLAAVVAMVGIVLASLLTAALGNVLRWSSPEFYANVLLDREVARLQIEQQSAMLIQLWWKQYKERKGIRTRGWRSVMSSVLERGAKLEHRVREAVGALQEARNKVHKPVEECLSHSEKLTQALRKVKELEARVEEIGRLLWQREGTGQSDPTHRLSLAY